LIEKCCSGPPPPASKKLHFCEHFRKFPHTEKLRFSNCSIVFRFARYLNFFVEKTLHQIPVAVDRGGGGATAVAKTTTTTSRHFVIGVVRVAARQVALKTRRKNTTNKSNKTTRGSVHASIRDDDTVCVRLMQLVGVSTTRLNRISCKSASNRGVCRPYSRNSSFKIIIIIADE